MNEAYGVRIDGVTYRVAQTLLSIGRGREYLLSTDTHSNVRVCHAPSHRVKAARTGGERLEYIWEKPE